MKAHEIRNAYIKFFENNSHSVIPRSKLVPDNDPSTLFTGSGMQPLVPYLLGEKNPYGTRLVDSQPCFRAQDIEEVGDNRHTTFFEMLGNWSLGDYFKKEQFTMIFNFLTDIVGLDPNKLYVTTFIGSREFSIPKDTESGDIWKKLFADKGLQADDVEIGSEENGYKIGTPKGARIFYYDASKNWWCRNGKMADMPVGEPGGPSSEIFYEFDFVEHNTDYGDKCHPNCDCGRFIEIGNNVLMQYSKTKDGFEQLPKKNIDFGGGLERIAMASIDSPDVFKISLLWPIIEKLEEISNKKYDGHTNSMRVIADHLRGAVFLAMDGVVPSNKEQGYVMRRIMRRAIRFAFDLGIEQDVCESIIPVVADMYIDDYPEIREKNETIKEILKKEEKIFRQTLRSGVREFDRISKNGTITGQDIFKLYDTYGFPAELSAEEAYKKQIKISENWRKDFDIKMDEQRQRSKTATKGTFKGGLADHSLIVTKYHTATHLMYRALKIVLGDHVVQRGSNITADRLRFDFSHPEKMTPEEIKQVEEIVNEQIVKDWPMSWREENTKKALSEGVAGAFGDKYGEMVKVYTVGDPDGENYSREICGGPHVEHTGILADGGVKFKILKEESSSAGVRRIKAVLI